MDRPVPASPCDPDKRTLLREIRSVIGERGRFLMYEPTSPDGEERSGYLARFERASRGSWTSLSPAEWQALMTHVRTCDLPETLSSWIALGREAGFSTVDELFRAPSDLYRMFCCRA